MFVDPKFQFLEEKLVSTTLNTTGARDHVPEVEKQIQVITERIRANYANLPFPSFKRRITIELATHVEMLLNTSPPKIGLSKTCNPRKIMKGKSLDWKKICKLHFGASVQVHKERNVTNTLEERTQGVICLGPTGNITRTYNFILIRSGKKITRRQFTEVKTPTIIMKRVEAMALAKKHKEGLIFENRTGATVNNILPDDEANEAFNKIDDNIAGVDWEVEVKEPTSHIPQLNINQYAALAGNDYDEENDNKRTGLDNDGKITGADSNNERTGEKPESGSTGATD